MSTIPTRKLWQGALLALALGAILAVFLALSLPAQVAGQSGTPAKPTGLLVSTTDGSLEVSVDWNDVSGATSYVVRWRERSAGSALNTGITVEASSATITVANSGEWIVRVEACNANGCGRGAAKGFEVTAAEPEETPTPTPQPKLGKPRGLSVRTADGSLEAAVDWQDVAGATSYLVRWRERSAGSDLNTGITVEDSSATITVANSGEWIVRVEACNANGCGRGAAKGFEVSPADPAPAQPTGLVVSAEPGSLAVSVDWDDVSGAASYVVRWREQGSAVWDDEVSVTVSSADFEVARYGQWEVQVEACADDRCGTGAAKLFEVEIVSVCQRTAQVRDKLEQLTGKNCDDITAADLARVTSLWLWSSGMTSLQAGDFNGLYNLKTLNLGSNQISALPEDAFAGLARLETLRLDYLPISTLPEDVFDGLVRLKTLSFYGSGLTALPEDVFDGLTNLERIYLTGNSLTALPEDVFDGLTNLEGLALWSNDIAALPPDVFDGLSNLERLWLGGNDLTTLPPDVFDGLSRLRLLWLAENPLGTLPEGIFDGLSSLDFLHLRWTRLTALRADTFEDTTNLRELLLDGNRLTTLPAGVFSGLTRLQELYLDNNDLTTLPAGVFDGLTGLRKLHIYWNDLETLPEDIFLGLTGIQELWLYENPGAPFDLNLPPGKSAWQ